MTIVKFNNPDDNYDETIKKINSCVKGNSVVLVWAIWCPHCISMKEDWERLSLYASDKVNFVEIESGNLEKIKSQNKSLFKKLYADPERVFFPMIKVLKDKKSSLYEDERSFDKMKQHIDKQFPKKSKKTSKKTTQKGGSKIKLVDIHEFQRELDSYIKEILKDAE